METTIGGWAVSVPELPRADLACGPSLACLSRTTPDEIEQADPAQPTYLINVRGADANAGYVTSGFWGGLTVGRVVLIPLTKRLGNRWSVFV